MMMSPKADYVNDNYVKAKKRAIFWDRFFYAATGVVLGIVLTRLIMLLNNAL